MTQASKAPWSRPKSSPKAWGIAVRWEPSPSSLSHLDTTCPSYRILSFSTSIGFDRFDVSNICVSARSRMARLKGHGGSRQLAVLVSTSVGNQEPMTFQWRHCHTSFFESHVDIAKLWRLTSPLPSLRRCKSSGFDRSRGMLKGIKCTFKTRTTRKKWACLPSHKSKGPENCNASSADMSSVLNWMCKFSRTQWRWTEPDARYCSNCWLLWLSRRLTAWNWKECKHFMSTCPCKSLADSLGSTRLDLTSKNFS